MPGAVIDPVDDYTILLTLNSKDDSMRQVHEMADLGGELFLLRN